MRRFAYNRDPDFTHPLFEISTELRESLLSRLSFLYGKESAEQWLPQLERVLKVHHAHKPQALAEAEKHYVATERFTQKDLVLITYGDSVKGEYSKTLAALHGFIQEYNRGVANTIHILPFFPYSSDRGFAVVDYKTVDPKIGTWDSVRNLSADYHLMFDGVVNHCSSRSEMFREYLKGNPQYRDFFIAYDSPDDLTEDQRQKIFRPRTSDILTRFDSIDGPKYVWTTFSEDQIDLNFRNPEVLLSVIEGLLFYVRRGADILRLDAVTYLWSEPGTECVHLPETHAIIKLIRTIMDAVAPGVAIITETNVPHAQNISYFGNGKDEAHMVYNFALPPLVLHTFYAKDTTAISQWADNLEFSSNTATYFNMLDTHDGVGLMGVKGILSKDQIAFLISCAKDHNAYISYKSTELGEEPYEINTTWWSALNKDAGSEELPLQVQRYVASRSLAFVVKGVPAIYSHGALAIPNDYELVKKTGVKRDINRSEIDPEFFNSQLQNPDSKRSLLRPGFLKLAEARTRNRAFHPQGLQKVLSVCPEVFAVYRVSPERDSHVLTLTNVTEESIGLSIPINALETQEIEWRDLLSAKSCRVAGNAISIDLQPYDVVWLTPKR